MSKRISSRLSEKAYAGVWGFIVGDALGVPYEFRTRNEMKAAPAIGMTGGGIHGQPPGTWSDDSSMMLCVLENNYALGTTHDLANLFLRWYKDSYHTPNGKVFDIGITTQIALDRFRNSKNICGLDDERSAGNGSLMRSLPYSFHEDFAEGAAIMQMDNLITHGVRLCNSCSVFYTSMARALAEGDLKETALIKAGEFLMNVWKSSDKLEMENEPRDHFKRLMSPGFRELPEKEIRSSGYVIESLEAAVWSFMNGTDYASSVLNAVNLGDDTDTNAGLAGGLAAIYYGIKDIPSEWLDAIVDRKHLDQNISRWVGLSTDGHMV
jgi:ADP-ribosylglycohydrolase